MGQKASKCHAQSKPAECGSPVRVSYLHFTGSSDRPPNAAWCVLSVRPKCPNKAGSALGLFQTCKTICLGVWYQQRQRMRMRIVFASNLHNLNRKPKFYNFNLNFGPQHLNAVHFSASERGTALVISICANVQIFMQCIYFLLHFVFRWQAIHISVRVDSSITKGRGHNSFRNGSCGHLNVCAYWSGFDHTYSSSVWVPLPSQHGMVAMARNKRLFFTRPTQDFAKLILVLVQQNGSLAS